MSDAKAPTPSDRPVGGFGDDDRADPGGDSDAQPVRADPPTGGTGEGDED
jgi:hypothetical protein